MFLFYYWIKEGLFHIEINFLLKFVFFVNFLNQITKFY